MPIVDVQPRFQKVPSDGIFSTSKQPCGITLLYRVGLLNSVWGWPLKFYCRDPYFQDGVQDSCHNRKTVKWVMGL